MFDYDGTLTLEESRVPKETEAVLLEIRKRRLAVLGIISGRDLGFLLRANTQLLNVFSFLVSDNGAVAHFEDTGETVVRGREWSRKARTVFSNVDFQIRFFDIVASSYRENAPQITKILKESGFEAKLTYNKDSVMITPPGVDKGTGVALAVEHFGATKDVEVTCFGDGENDLPLFAPADRTVAVSNAVDSLKKIADTVTSLPGGLGVVEYLQKNLLRKTHLG